PDALPANRALECGIMGLQILNDRLHLAVDQSELLGQCRSEIGWFCRLRGFGPRLHSLAVNSMASCIQFIAANSLSGNDRAPREPKLIRPNEDNPDAEPNHSTGNSRILVAWSVAGYHVSPLLIPR